MMLPEIRLREKSPSADWGGNVAFVLAPVGALGASLRSPQSALGDFSRSLMMTSSRSHHTSRARTALVSTSNQTNNFFYLKLLQVSLNSTSLGNKYQLMTKSRLRNGTEPAVFVPEYYY